MSLHLLNSLKSFKIHHRPGEKLQLRIGTIVNLMYLNGQCETYWLLIMRAAIRYILANMDFDQETEFVCLFVCMFSIKHNNNVKANKGDKKFLEKINRNSFF